jgi:hypothetical protein
VGWYQREPTGRYKPNVGDVNSVLAQRLPAERGIVMKVCTDGRAWYAWRRTVSGWVFAVGGKGNASPAVVLRRAGPPRG